MQRYPAGRRAVAAVLKDARKSVGLSQRKLSERLGRLDKYGHMIESAQQGISAEEFMAWAWACETSGSALMRCAEQLLKAQGQREPSSGVPSLWRHRSRLKMNRRSMSLLS